MDEEGLAHQWTPITGETRTCIIIADTAAGAATVVNEHGPVVTAEEWTRFVADVTATAARAEMVCFCGSMIRGADAVEYAALVGSVAKNFADSSPMERGVRVWVDTSGAALKAMLTVPYIGIKVNGDEAGAILGRAVVTPEEAVVAAHDLMQHGALGVVLTLGKRGAVKVTSEGAWVATPPTIRVLDPIGSGDSFLAGLVTAQAQGLPADEQLRYAVAAGTANALSVGGGAFSQAEFEQVLSQTTLKQL
jgi:1-phosphofructokinase family hexose kinase